MTGEKKGKKEGLLPSDGVQQHADIKQYSLVQNMLVQQFII